MKLLVDTTIKSLGCMICFGCQLLLLPACDETPSTVALPPQNDSLQTDSAKFEQYYQWSKEIDYIEAYEYPTRLPGSLEQNRDSAFLLSFLASNYDLVKLYDDFPYEAADLVQYVYEVDINGDGRRDVIYEGPTGGEANITQIFLNKGQHYEKVFSGYQGFIKIDFSDSILNAFTLIHPGCCADPQFVEYDYTVIHDDEVPEFKLTKTTGYLSETEKPKELFTTPLEFKVKSANARLRSDCYRLDQVEHPVYGTNGNNISVYHAGAQGKAVAFKRDDNTEWIYVRMNATTDLDSCDFTTFKEHPTELLGWMLKSDTDLD